MLRLYVGTKGYYWPEGHQRRFQEMRFESLNMHYVNHEN